MQDEVHRLSGKRHGEYCNGYDNRKSYHEDRGEVACHCGGGIEASTIENEDEGDG